MLFQGDDGLAQCGSLLKLRPIRILRIDDVRPPFVFKVNGTSRFLIQELEDLRDSLWSEGQLQKPVGYRFQLHQLMMVTMNDVGVNILGDIDEADFFFEDDHRKIVFIGVPQDIGRYLLETLNEFDAQPGYPAFHQLLNKLQKRRFRIPQTDPGGENQFLSVNKRSGVRNFQHMNPPDRSR